jgi:hypothetical protein
MSFPKTSFSCYGYREQQSVSVCLRGPNTRAMHDILKQGVTSEELDEDAGCFGAEHRGRPEAIASQDCVEVEEGGVYGSVHAPEALRIEPVLKALHLALWS